MGYALAARQGDDLREAAAVLLASRPTAVNLPWAIARMQAPPADPEELMRRARRLHREEIARCAAMSEHGADLLTAGSRVLTHCNTGALATAGSGSALGAIRTGFERGLVDHVYVDETRPLLQGARLTAWELERAGIPYDVIVDAAAGAIMARGEVTHVLVGADRIAVNGDVANKIGTYGLAVLAAYHRLPLIVVAPTSTIDGGAPTGSAIPVEERLPAEVSARFPARNPAFDVTPAALVTAIVTEAGVYRPPYDLSTFPELRSQGAAPGLGERR
jgi:methylthioribose-1-phosphate isomerase